MRVIKTSTIKPYIALTKPGIIRGNLLTTIAGFFLAANGVIDYGLLLAVLIGTTLIIASACTFNNFTDRNIDARMFRTRGRALVQKAISSKNALIFATVLGLGGALVLILFTNMLTSLIGLLGFVMYVVVYGYAKRKSWYGTHIGSISGALPPVAGYVAVSGHIDTAAAILFVILVCWQMPHFFAIAMYRSNDYKAANVPVLPNVRGMRTTKIHVLAYIIAFGIASVLLTCYGYTGYVYLVVMLLLVASWLWLGIKRYSNFTHAQWGKSMFLFSLIVISIQSVLLTINSILP